MTKNNKSAATIRRRKNKPMLELLGRVRKHKPHGAGDSGDPVDKAEEAFLHKEVLGSSVIAKIMSSDKTIFLGLVVIRLVNALLIQTSFVPDEYWQSMEVAHNMVFNYGYMTWEWRAGIRSYAYPLLLATLYKVLAVLGLDYRQLLIRGPRLLQGVMASCGDMYLYRLSARLAGRQVAQWTLLCQLLSWFTAYCCTRTLTNCVETTLVTAALFYFPWPGCQSRGDLRRFVALAAMSVVVRPTAAVLWLLLVAWHLQRCKGPALWHVFRTYLTTGVCVLAVTTLVDRVWYGRWVLVHLNFLHFNVVSGGSGFYGRHPWHWYLTQGAPVVLGPHLLPFALGAWKARHKVLLMLCLWHVFIFSLLAHKEFRFLLPVLPLTMHYCGLYFHSLTQPTPTPTPTPSPSSHQQGVDGGGGGEAGGGGDDEGETKKSEDEKSEKKTADAGTDATCKKSAEGGTMQEEEEESGQHQVRRRTKASLKQSDGSDQSSSNPVGGGNSSNLKENTTNVKKDTSTKRRPPKSGEAESEVSPPHTPSHGHKGEGEKAELLSSSSQNGGPEQTTTKREEEEGGKEESKPKEKEAAKESGGNSQSRGVRRARKVRLLALLLAVSNLPPILYFSLIHQRGTLDVMNFLHHQHQLYQQRISALRNGPSGSNSSRIGPMDVLFLMPCHSTPYYSHLHANISLTFLTCEPNLLQLANYMDEADVFFQDPASWLMLHYGVGAVVGSNASSDLNHSGSSNTSKASDTANPASHPVNLSSKFADSSSTSVNPSSHLVNSSSNPTNPANSSSTNPSSRPSLQPLPTHVVYFSPLKEDISPFLQQGRYSQCARLFHTHFPEGRMGSHVLVSCRS